MGSTLPFTQPCTAVWSQPSRLSRAAPLAWLPTPTAPSPPTSPQPRRSPPSTTTPPRVSSHLSTTASARLRLMLKPMPGDTDTPPLSTDMDPAYTDTHLPDTDTTTARGPLMPSPKLRLRPMLTTDTPDTPVSTTPLSTDTDPASTDMDTDTPMAPDTLTTDKK